MVDQREFVDTKYSPEKDVDSELKNIGNIFVECGLERILSQNHLLVDAIRLKDAIWTTCYESSDKSMIVALGMLHWMPPSNPNETVDCPQNYRLDLSVLFPDRLEGSPVKEELLRKLQTYFDGYSEEGKTNGRK